LEKVPASPFALSSKQNCPSDVQASRLVTLWPLLAQVHRTVSFALMAIRSAACEHEKNCSRHGCLFQVMRDLLIIVCFGGSGAHAASGVVLE
jgi:hypothetical protein